MTVTIDEKDIQKTGIETISVRTAKTLVLSDIVDLLEGRLIALRIANYYPQEEVERASKQLLKHTAFERYLRAPDIGVQRTGITFFETNGSWERLERYYEEAYPSIKSLRQTFFPYLSPIDKLRVELEDIWLAGTYIENIHGRRMLVGIGRVFEDGFELPPHQDVLLRDILDAPLPPTHSLDKLIVQCSANIYLRPADIGGELEIWDEKPSSGQQKAIRDQKYKYEGIVDRRNLPPAAAVIKPSAGDLILFDAGRIHAVRPSKGGPRLSMSMFIGYRGQDKPLTYWS
ncbi:2OG-Fe(II) oxygenase [Microseira wollei]|uniref:Prolyl 4-hydroxylase alpha subunit Fe(2+) 2OG dioxygenase domain-containing protein n=1 Tax=Microseira wollei NIES-4236 TaxID=2530354 RepID=A0AAV3XG90_9CYAN|nr:2OG-Fe(II) oxygenase [Microseira wollei]GET39930.1 hypothetical protein MiSe_47020 [Microseira wollei NIES-4236]